MNASLLMNQLKYRADIDGLRAVAVLGVVFYHAGFGFPGGYTGVDVFFVISGFLITSLIVADLEGGRFSFAGFWERRARRILPALSVMVLAVLVAGWFFLLPADFETLGKQAIALAFLSSNIKFWMESGYFDSIAEEKPLLHTWSLSLEEQFYLLIPLLLWAAYRWRKPGAIVALLAVIAAASGVLSLWGTYKTPEAAFYLLPFRAWELAVGSLLAFAKPIADRRLREASGWVGVVSILAAFFVLSAQTPFPGFAALLPVGGAALVIWSGLPLEGVHAPQANRLLTLKMLVGVGLISYSLYLWHWPLLAFDRYLSLQSPSPAVRLALVVCGFVLAWLSYRFVEKPFRRKGWPQTRTKVFVWSAGAVAAVVASGLLIWIFRGYPERLPAEAVRFAEGKNDWLSTEKGNTRLDDIPGKLERIGDETKPPSVFLWGDSHAMAILPVLDAVGRETSFCAAVAKSSAVAPVADWQDADPRRSSDALVYNRAVLAAIKDFARSGNLKTVILAARWSGYTSSDNQAFRQNMEKTVKELSDAGCSVVILHEVPNFSFEPPKALALAAMRGEDLSDLTTSVDQHRKRVGGFLDVFNGLSQRLPNVHVLDPESCLADAEGVIKPQRDGVVLYRDGNHLTTSGSMLLKSAFMDTLRRQPEESATNGNDKSQDG